MKLDEFVAYQKDAIVSKEIIRKERGTITVFAFDKGQGLSEHTAPFDAFVQILDGKGRITIAGEEHFLDKNEAIVMPANKPHAVYAAEQFKMLLVMIKQ